MTTSPLPPTGLEMVDLPPELLAHILQYLEPKEIAMVSGLCTAFYGASRIESIWLQKCLEFPIGPFPTQNCDLIFREVYTKVLHHYGRFLGFWMRRLTGHYGGLLVVKFDSNLGKIIGTEWGPPKDHIVLGPLRSFPAFAIQVTSADPDGIVCCGSVSALTRLPDFHQCKLTGFWTLGTNEQGSLTTFYRECLDPDLHVADYEDPLVNPSPGLRMMMRRKATSLSLHKHCYSFSRLDWPFPMSKVLIQPGLFKGDYGSHGVELILLTYNEDATKVLGTKVTGDPNIPAGQITFKANLADALLLTHEQQETLQKLRDAEVMRPSIPLDQIPMQPFVLTQGVDGRPNNEIPPYCKARFAGLGQIASDGYINSSFIPGHWIVFTENLFAFLWFDLQSIVKFHRVEETF